MKTKVLYTIALIFVLGITNSNAQEPCKEVIGYYPGWQWYDRDKLVNPETIDYAKYTIINYAFLYPLADGTLTITDPWSDKNLLLGAIDWGTAPLGYESSYDLGNSDYHIPNTSLVYHAHENDTKVMISLGGWTLSSDFPAIAADPTKRTNFAHSCNELIRVYDIDGIDIDWEYPGYTPHGGTEDDIINYSLLLNEVRDSLDAIEPLVSKELLLTAAFGAAPDRMDDIEWDVIIETLDYINLMSYDFFGAFSPETNHNSPLYAPVVGDPTFNIHSAVERLITDHGVPESMINMGVAFYGRTAKTVGEPGLHVPTTGATDAVTFSIDEGSPQYYNVMDKMFLFNEHWDSDAEVPYLTGLDDLNTFVSYDDEASIGLKAQYVVDNNLAGVIIWEITGDYMETSPGSGIIAGTPLADTLNLVLCHITDDGSDDSGIDKLPIDKSNVNLYPNPATDNIYVKTKNNEIITSIEIINTVGQTIFAIQPNLSGSTVDLSFIQSGHYIAKIQLDAKTYYLKFLKN